MYKWIIRCRISESFLLDVRYGLFLPEVAIAIAITIIITTMVRFTNNFIGSFVSRDCLLMKMIKKQKVCLLITVTLNSSSFIKIVFLGE